jgi:hypothetical protein
VRAAPPRDRPLPWSRNSGPVRLVRILPTLSLPRFLGSAQVVSEFRARWRDLGSRPAMAPPRCVAWEDDNASAGGRGVAAGRAICIVRLRLHPESDGSGL